MMNDEEENGRDYREQQPRAPGADSAFDEAQQGFDCYLAEILEPAGNHLGPAGADDENSNQYYAGYPAREEGVGDDEVGALIWAFFKNVVLVFVQLPIAVLLFLVFSVKEFDIVIVSPAGGNDLGGKVNGRLGENTFGGLAGGFRCWIPGRSRRR